MPGTLVIQDEEKTLIQRAYRKLLRSIKVNMDDTDRKNIRMAYEIAVEAHSKQRRKSGEPYILHPIEVARICAEEIGLGPTAIVAALLHDTVEDTDVTLEEIRERFGPKIMTIVDGLTKLKEIEPTIAQVENFRKVLSTLIEDVRVVLIKMADRLHNMRTISSMPEQTQLKITAETSYIYAPLAHRLGLYNVKTELQDICLKINEPVQYQDIVRKLQETKDERNQYIQEFIEPLKSQLEDLGVPYRIHGRPKSISSIFNKLKRKAVPFEEIYDLFAVRIIVNVPVIHEKSICWQVYSIVTDVYTPVPERLKDWVSTPKANGYESLHTTVIGPGGRYVEVQIRSERMDEIAEKGFAAHWKYKGVIGHKDRFGVWLDNIREILEDPDKDAMEFINDFKNNLFSEEIFAYTPNGDMKILPKGATALDFAFGIHTDVGYHCKAIKVNNKLVPMGYELENGDQVQVTTAKNQKPNESWLNMVVTSRAKSKIKSALKEVIRKKGIFGKEALQRKLQHIKVDFEENVDILVKHFGFKNRPDFYYAIAQERINLAEIKHYPVENGRFALEKQKPLLLTPETGVRKIHKKSNTIISINGEPGEQYDYSFASCCHPVLGDHIFAFVTTNAGVKIHRASCPNAEHLISNYGYRILKADWVSDHGSDFVADLVITGIDTGPGVIERLTNKISSNLGLNIRSFSIEGNEGYFEGKVSLIVANINQINQAIIALKSMEGISSVTRID